MSSANLRVLEAETTDPLELFALHDAAGIYTFIDVWAPELRHDARAYDGRVWIEREGDSWTKPRGHVDLRRLLAVHAYAGKIGETWPYCKGAPELVAVHLKAAPNERVRALNIDVDRDALRCVSVLRGIFGPSMMVVPGSGRTGRCRVLVPIEQLPVHEAHARAVALLEAHGLTKSAGVEVFPDPNRQSRVPFGAGAAVELDDELRPLQPASGFDLTRKLLRKPKVDLRKLAPTVDAPRPPYPSKPLGPSKKPKVERSRRNVEAGATDAMVLQWIREGVAGLGERDQALFAILVYFRDRDRLPLHEATKRIVQWVREGKLRRASPEHHNVEREARDAARRARAVYRVPARGRPRPLHLSASEVLEVERIASERAPAAGVPTEALSAFLYAVLPSFKAAARAGMRKLSMHCSRWEQAAAHAGRAGRAYDRLRRASGLFESDGSYMPAARLRARGWSDQDARQHARSQEWTCSFTFDAEAPSRALGRTWTAALLAARRLKKRSRSTQGLDSASESPKRSEHMTGNPPASGVPLPRSVPTSSARGARAVPEGHHDARTAQARATSGSPVLPDLQRVRRLHAEGMRLDDALREFDRLHPIPEFTPKASPASEVSTRIDDEIPDVRE